MVLAAPVRRPEGGVFKPAMASSTTLMSGSAVSFPGSAGSSSLHHAPTTSTPPRAPSSAHAHGPAPHLPFRRISLPSGPPPALNLSAHAHRASMGPGSFPDASPKRSRRQSHTPSAKRARVQVELVETERAYVAGLELVYEHFLSPLLASLQTSVPILPRSELPKIFANFVDIWNLHRTAFLPAIEGAGEGQLGGVLLSHFPYLSLYTPFVTAFGTTLSTLAQHQASGGAFNNWLKAREADPACKNLGLRDYLLSIIQRCPRYLLLLKVRRCS